MIYTYFIHLHNFLFSVMFAFHIETKTGFHNLIMKTKVTLHHGADLKPLMAASVGNLNGSKKSKEF